MSENQRYYDEERLFPRFDLPENIDLFSKEEKTSVKAKTKVFHLGEYDVLANMESEGYNEIVENFSELTNAIDSFQGGDYPDTLESWGTKRGFFMEISGVEYYIKRKTPSGARTKNLGYNEQTTWDPSTRRRNSISNEIKLSTTVEDILSSEAAQSVASRYGFETIGYIKPVAGLVHNIDEDETDGQLRGVREKYIVFPSANGSRTVGDLFYDNSKKSSIDQMDFEHYIRFFVSDFRSLFRKYGIEANDISVENFIVSDDGKHLYLIDIEEYRQINS